MEETTITVERKNRENQYKKSDFLTKRKTEVRGTYINVNREISLIWQLEYQQKEPIESV